MKSEPRRRARLTAGLLAGAMLLSVSPLVGLTSAGAADQLPPVASPIADGAVCDGAPGTNPFTDLGAESATTREVILCLVATDLTAGTTATTYSPGGTVTRRQMALFIKRLADLMDALEADVDLEELPAYDNVPDYTDVLTEDPVFQEAIGQLTQAEIVGGFGDGTFRPGDSVSRRQMAAFVNRLQEFLTGQAFSTDNDYFDDDNGDSGEDDLNALASVGIFQGDGEGSVDPGDSLSRRQMANILLRDVQVAYAAGAVSSPFETGLGMPELNIAPTDHVALEFEADIDATTAGDDRTYTASELPASEGGYQVSLVRIDKIYESDGGSFRFEEQGTTGLVNNGGLEARIVKVNGAPAGPAQTIGAIEPQNGVITITVDGDGTDSLRPVISVDGGDDTRLEIDDDGVPTEPFGVGGQLDYRPAEAADGAPVAGTVALVHPDFAVVDTTAIETTVMFHSGDTYRIGTAGDYAAATAAEFEAALSNGDTLHTCGDDAGAPAGYAQGAGNGYCLIDDSPESPPDVGAFAGTPSDTTVRLDWRNAPVADAYNVYANAQSCTNTSVDELAEIGQVPALDTEHVVRGLDPSTTYCFVVTTVEGADESAVEVGTGANDTDNTSQFATTAAVSAPTIVSAALTTDVDTGAVSVGDVISLTFSEPMEAGSVTDSTFEVTDADGDTTTIVCTVGTPLDEILPAPDDGSTSARCELGDGADATVADDTLTITIAEDGDDDNTAGGNDDIEYPLTITAITGLNDANDNQGVDLAASADKTIS